VAAEKLDPKTATWLEILEALPMSPPRAKPGSVEAVIAHMVSGLPPYGEDPDDEGNAA
jgi:hypothetical protein